MRAAATLIAISLAILSACGGNSGDDTQRAAPTPLDPATTGRVVVHVRLDGTPPPSRTLTMIGECARDRPQPGSADDVLVHDGAVQNGFVWISGGLGERTFAVPDAPVVIDQKDCLYVPHVAGAQVAQKVEFRNSDATLHNVHGKPNRSTPWNVALARAGATRMIVVEHAEVPISVRCDVHPWMQAWLAVVDHPFFGVSGADGTVVLAGVPAGEYTVSAWHERLGTAQATVTVAAKETRDLTITLPGA